MHLGTANTMTAIGDLVKKTVRKVFSARALPCPASAPLLAFCSEMSRPFQHNGVDFAGPLVYRERRTDEGKAFVLIFTCPVVRAVHLDVTKSCRGN